MKVFLAFLVLVGLAVSQAEDSYKECTDETGITESETSGYLLDDDDANDPKATKFLVCVFKKDGALDDDGKLVVEKAKESVQTYMKEIDAADDQQSLDCIKEQDTAEETVLVIAKCVEKRRAELTNSKK